MTMIEQIARASHDFFRPIYNLPPFDGLPADAKSTMFQHAAAILDAMKNPTAEMVAAAANGTAFASASPAEIECGWYDMVLAANKEPA